MDGAIEDGRVIVVVLVDEALSAFQVIRDGLLAPPVGRVAVLIALAT